MLALIVFLLPVAGAPPEAVRAAQDALHRALPAPFEAGKLDVALFDEHLAAAGATCRGDLPCVCAAAGFTPRTWAVEVEVTRLSAKAWAVDVLLVAPCEDRVLDRRAAVVEASAAAVQKFVSEAALAVLRAAAATESGRAATSPSTSPPSAAAIAP